MWGVKLKIRRQMWGVKLKIRRQMWGVKLKIRRQMWGVKSAPLDLSLGDFDRTNSRLFGFQRSISCKVIAVICYC